MYCSACDEVLVDNITIPATGVYTEVSIPGREATCTEEGLTEGKKCSVCGEILVAQQTVAKKAHTEVKIPAVAPTCTQDGLTAGRKCSVCGEILVAQQKDPAKGHTEVKIPGKEATSTETGLTAKRGDRLITLVTCASHTDNRRFVVVAREKRS